jgi:thymidylate synthase (FAD)
MIRHRTASVNEYSTRYSEAINANQKTDPDEWRTQAKSNKQGSGGFIKRNEGGIHLTERENALQKLAREVYEERLAMGVAREQARKDLPLSTYTEAYWKIDLHNLLHFLALRLNPHAQKEIRDYAIAISDIVKLWVPATWEAFEDFRLNASYLSAQEIEIVRILADHYEMELPWDDDETSHIVQLLHKLSKREVQEFGVKTGIR